MRDFSKIKTSLWNSKRLRSLGDEVLTPRLLYCYLLSNKHGNSAGCFDLDPLYVCADMQCKKEDFDRCIIALSEAFLIDWDGLTNTVLIHKWEQENAPTNPKHAMGLFAHMESASSERLRSQCFNVFVPIIKALKFDQTASVRAAMERVRIGLSETLERQSPPRPETQTQTQTETLTRPYLDLREKTQTAGSPPATLSGGGLPPSEHEDDPVLLYEKMHALKTAKSMAGPSSRLLETELMKRVL
jgi:hypothetical protein